MLPIHIHNTSNNWYHVYNTKVQTPKILIQANNTQFLTLMFFLHVGHWWRWFAHPSQVTRCPQGRKEICTSSSKQTLHLARRACLCSSWSEFCSSFPTLCISLCSSLLSILFSSLACCRACWDSCEVLSIWWRVSATSCRVSTSSWRVSATSSSNRTKITVMYPNLYVKVVMFWGTNEFIFILCCQKELQFCIN